MGYVGFAFVDVARLVSKAKALVRIFSYSTLLMGELMNIQEKVGLTRTKPVKANKTRWNSVFDMLTWIISNKKAIQTFDISNTDVLTRAQLPEGSRYGDAQMSGADWGILSMFVRYKCRNCSWKMCYRKCFGACLS